MNSYSLQPFCIVWPFTIHFCLGSNIHMHKTIRYFTYSFPLPCHMCLTFSKPTFISMYPRNLTVFFFRILTKRYKNKILSITLAYLALITQEISLSFWSNCRKLHDALSIVMNRVINIYYVFMHFLQQYEWY